MKYKIGLAIYPEEEEIEATDHHEAYAKGLEVAKKQLSALGILGTSNISYDMYVTEDDGSYKDYSIGPDNCPVAAKE